MIKLRKLCAEELEKEHLSVLRELGRQIGVKSPASKKKEELIEKIINIQDGKEKSYEHSKSGAPTKLKVDISKYLQKNLNEDFEYPIVEVDSKITLSDVDTSFEVEGVLELHADGYGFLRTGNYESSKRDIFVSSANIKKYRLRRGDKVLCKAKIVREGESAALQKLLEVNGIAPESSSSRVQFDDLIPCYPDCRIKLEIEGQENDIAVRCVDLFAPIGRGQRGLIVAPPKTGKTTLLKKIAQSIEKNYKDITLIILLIDERPEEVTDIKRSVSAEVIFSTFDESAEHHIRAAELTINRAKRLVENGTDVVILMDSITRLARAYNSVVESSGKTLSGGLDPVAMAGPKRFFGAARNIENGGSLTILSTALVETGSRMDDVIYEEFKGTGNMEIHLSRALSERRIFPAIDLYKSGTRKDDLLLTEKELSAVYKLRQILIERQDATDSLLEMLKKSKNNEDFLTKLDAWIKIYKKEL